MKLKNFVLTLLMISMFVTAAASQARVANTPPQPNRGNKDIPAPPTPPLDAEEYVIGPEDVLSIVVWAEPDLSQKVTVRPDGKIGMPLLNDVQASGLTPKQLTANLTEALKTIANGPRVTVIVQEIHSQIVYVTGSIGKSGVYSLGGPMTIMELLVRAGGLLEFAKTEDIQILRQEGDKLRRLRFNYKTFSEGRDYQQNIRLRNRDMVIIP